MDTFSVIIIKIVKERGSEVERYSLTGEVRRAWVGEAGVWRSVPPAQHPGLVFSGPVAAG